MKEEFKELWKKYKTGIVVESILRAILCSFLIVFSLSILFYMFWEKLYFMSIIVLLILLPIFYTMFYFSNYPNELDFARKLDEFGLKQRVVTMSENMNSESLMSRIQRLDAIEKVNNNKDKFKVKISIKKLIASCIMFLITSAMIVITSLSSNGVIASGKDILNPIVEQHHQYEITYEVDGEGSVTIPFQVLYEDETGDGVLAIADDGWEFIGWSDGVETDYRVDSNLTHDVVVIAQFQELDEESQDGDVEGDGEPKDEDGKPGDEPTEGTDGNGEGNEDSNGQDGNGHYDENNQVFDGETYYGGSTYDEYYQDMLDDLSSDSGVPSNIKSMIGDYFHCIEK